MGRPAKPIALMSQHLTKEEIKLKTENEARFKTDKLELQPPEYFNEEQKQIYEFLVDQLRVANILNNTDTFMLEMASIAIDRVQYIEEQINQNRELLFDKTLLAQKRTYTQDLVKACVQLGLSPQARSKLATLKVEVDKKKTNPIAQGLAR